MLISLDTETTGTDYKHGAAPFYVTITYAHEDIKKRIPIFWEFDVLQSREVLYLPEDVVEIQSEIDKAERIVGQNLKFDAKMLENIGVRIPFEKVEDTLIAGHLLASHQPHDLTSMMMYYLGIDIEHYEKALEVACHECHKLVKREEKSDWKQPIAKYRTAKKGLADMPSAKEKCWRLDYWLPRMLAKELNYDPTHSYWKVLQNYSNADSYYTLALWEVMEKKLKEEGLWKIYRERMRLPSIIKGMEGRGVTQSIERTAEIVSTYEAESSQLEDCCISIAEQEYGYPLNLPTGGRNASLVDFIHGKQGLGLKCIKYTDKGNPSFDAETLEHLDHTLNPDNPGYHFIRNYAQKKKRDKFLGDLEGYKRYWIYLKENPGWAILYPSLNQTGSGTLRFSSSNPNSQNLGRKEIPCIRCFGDGCEKCNHLGYDPRTIRYCFGPLPEREWYSLDAKNLERRIPAYEASEEESIRLFEHSDDPPYYGSEHGLVAHLLWREEFEACGDARAFKKKYSSTLNAWTKNGNFALQYNCGRHKANATFHHPNAYDLIKGRFAKQEKLNQHWIRFAKKTGYVETIPDKLVDPTRGYPLFCQRGIDYSISPTIPLSYHIQGTAMWWMAIAMVAVQEQLDKWNKDRVDGEGFYLIMQIHDELVFDFPKSKVHPDVDTKREKETGESSFLSNLWRVRVLQKLMEKCGDRIGIPTPVNVEYHAYCWSESKTY